MPKDLYLIVKEANVHDILAGSIPEYRKQARKVIDEIEKIKCSSDYLSIKDSSRLHPKMPLPSDELRVWVCGALKNYCCSIQMYNLRKAGYNVRFHPTACLDFLRLPKPERFMPGFKLLVPEFYDN